MTIGRPTTSTRWISGSLTFCGSLLRTRVTASLMSFSARSVLVSSRNAIGGDRNAVGDRRRDMPDAFDAGNAVLDGLGDLRLKLGRRGAELRDDHRYDRDVGVRQARDRQLGMKLIQPSVSRMIDSTIEGSG